MSIKLICNTNAMPDKLSRVPVVKVVHSMFWLILLNYLNPICILSIKYVIMAYCGEFRRFIAYCTFLVAIKRYSPYLLKLFCNSSLLSRVLFLLSKKVRSDFKPFRFLYRKNRSSNFLSILVIRTGKKEIKVGSKKLTTFI